MKNKVLFGGCAILLVAAVVFGAVSVNGLKEEQAVLLEKIQTVEATDTELRQEIEALKATVESLIDSETDLLVEQCRAEIESIGEVTFEDEELIKDLELTYAGMTEKQKNKLVNYVDLKNARRELNRLIAETAVEGTYKLLNQRWDGYFEIIPTNSQKSEGEILEYYYSSDEYKLGEIIPYTIDGHILKLEGEEDLYYIDRGNILMTYEDAKCVGEIPEGECFQAVVLLDGYKLTFNEDGTADYEDAEEYELTYTREDNLIRVTDGTESIEFYVYENELYYEVLLKQ